jgi:hypothetical protein
VITDIGWNEGPSRCGDDECDISIRTGAKTLSALSLLSWTHGRASVPNPAPDLPSSFPPSEDPNRPRPEGSDARRVITKEREREIFF